MAMLWLAAPALAESNAPPASASKAGPTPILPAIAINLNGVGENRVLPAYPRLSPWTKEIVKLAQSGIEEFVMLAFIDNSGTFGLGADQIIYLSDIGVSGSVINAMLQHDRELISGERLPTSVSEPPYEPLFTMKLVSSSKTRSETVKPNVASSVTVATGASEANPLPASSQPVSTATVVAHQPFGYDLEATSAFATKPQQPSSEKKRSLYPVREPYAVELLPPIVFFNVPEVTPNTLVVYGFPRP